MRYESSTVVKGDSSKALEFAVTVFAGVGFRITSRAENAVELAGPGMNNTRGNPLRGVSAVRVQTDGNRLSLDADLGGVEWISKFLFWFPILLCLGIGVFLSILFLKVLGPGPWIWIVVAVVSINGMLWNVLGPFLSRRIAARTRSALDTLLTNAGSMS